MDTQSATFPQKHSTPISEWNFQRLYPYPAPSGSRTYLSLQVRCGCLVLLHSLDWKRGCQSSPSVI